MVVASKLVKSSLQLVHHFDHQHILPAQQQKKTLINLLRKAEHTTFGTQYGFKKILDHSNPVEQFKARVPIFDYDEIHRAWWRHCQEGQSDVCWKGTVKYFALSSGTTGASSKYIPITIDMMRAMRQSALRMFACLPKYDFPSDLYFKDWLMIGGSASLQKIGHGYAGDLSGINARKPPLWIKKFYKPGSQIAKLKKWDDRVKAITQNAHKWDVAIVTGIPSWVQLTLEHVIDYYGINNIHEIWPNLKVFVSGGVAFAPYRKSFEQLLGHPIIYQDSYLASEGFLAFQSRPGTNAMKLILNNGIFFEFIPFTEANFDKDGLPVKNAAAVGIDEVEEGVDYALLISTCAGAWRYLIGDTIRFTDREQSEIIITGRTKQFLSLCGEHLSVDNMNQGILKAEQSMNIEIKEFSVAGVRAGNQLAHRRYIGCALPVDKERLIAEKDEQLQTVNDDYRAERSAMLQFPQIHLVPTQRFYDWQRTEGKFNGQSKIPRVLKKEILNRWEAFFSKP